MTASDLEDEDVGLQLSILKQMINIKDIAGSGPITRFRLIIQSERTTVLGLVFWHRDIVR